MKAEDMEIEIKWLPTPELEALRKWLMPNAQWVEGYPTVKVCECGAAKLGAEPFAPGHSTWCPVVAP